MKFVISLSLPKLGNFDLLGQKIIALEKIHPYQSASISTHLFKIRLTMAGIPQPAKLCEKGSAYCKKTSND